MERNVQERIEVCVTTDGAYVLPTAVMLTSLKANKSAESLYRVHCICTGVPKDLEDKLIELNAPDFEICINRVELGEVSGVSTWGHISSATLLRFKLPEFLPELDKVLYLDGDIIVRTDLRELYNTPLDNDYAAAVRDMEIKTHICNKGTPVPIPEYVNCGVMLFNLKLLRQDGMGQKWFEALSANPDWFLDQDTINTLCAGRIRILPFRYNAVSIQLAWKDLDGVNHRYGTNYPDWVTLEEDIAILHIAGPEKPWKQLNAPYSDIWMHYHNQSPFANSILNRDIALSPAFAYALRLCLYEWALKLIDKLPLHSVTKQKNTVHIRLLRYLPLMRIEETAETRNFRLFGILPPIRTKK